jgi:hypothetical protein
MFNNNRHLNIFEHYTQKGSLPIENNISRGLAILLNENSLVLDRFIDLINSKCIDKKSECIVLKPQRQEDKDIGIQQQITKIVSNYPNPQNIVGITLTTASPINMLENKKDDSNNLITDIVIRCKDTLVVIEVKRNATDARLQLKQQVNSIISEVVRQGGNVPDKELLDGTWEEVIAVLQDVYNLTGNSNESILGHYLKHLEHNYQEWFPISLFTDIDIKNENEVAVNKRILKLIQNCCENENDEKKYSGRYIIPLNYDFTTEAQISMDYDTNRLMITIWCGDTKWQGNCLLNKTNHDLSWIYKDLLNVDGNALEVHTDPYLRLAHFQTSIVIEYFIIDYYKRNFDNSKDKCHELYNDISKEWKRQDWDQLKQLLESKYNGLIDINSFNSSFRNKFEDSNRSYAHVSFGYETTVYLPLNIIKKYEKNTNKNNDELAKFISKIITELISNIE